jgi:hypothetical protein
MDLSFGTGVSIEVVDFRSPAAKTTVSTPAENPKRPW